MNKLLHTSVTGAAGNDDPGEAQRPNGVAERRIRGSSDRRKFRLVQTE